MIRDKVIKAYNISKGLHEGQMRKYSDKPYFTHPKYVARIIEDLTKDEDLVCVALLHDTLEDTKYTYKEMYNTFGEKISKLVMELTSDKNIIDHIGKVKYLTDKMNKMSNEALLIKLADRLHNIKYLDKDCKTRKHLNFVKKYYLETVEIMAGLNYSDKSDEVNLLVNGIQYHLDYLTCKHKWI